MCFMKEAVESALYERKPALGREGDFRGGLCVIFVRYQATPW